MTTNAAFTHMRSAVIFGVVLSVTALGAQTVITPPDNKYTPAQDVELGHKAAVEVEQQLPILRDEEVTSLVASIGRRVVDAIPQEFRHAEFRYSFQVDQRARDQRVRAPWRTDVLQSRDDPGGAHRRRSRRRDGA